uniref:Nuclear transcription factor Y subunit gamma n=2 Tax=Plectus sambesii TaxID=2011161 RepID=A0A914UZT0_9BILA
MSAEELSRQNETEEGADDHQAPPVLMPQTIRTGIGGSGVKLIIQPPPARSHQGQMIAGTSAGQPILAPSGGAMQPTFKFKTIQPAYDPQKMLNEFWPRQKTQIEAIDVAHLRDANRHQELPLARIKKIMKLDDDVKNQMISAEAPVLFAKAAEIFIEELTLRSWVHTEENKRKTLQKSDISMAISRCEQFDFLIDIVPRDESLHKQSKMQHHSTATPCRTLNEMDQSGQTIVLDQSMLAAGGTPVRFQSESTGDGGIQYFIQMPGNSTTPLQTQHMNESQLTPTTPLVQLQNGQMVQATQIGQPIPFQTTPGQSVQLIAVGSDGQPIQLQLQLPQSQMSVQNENDS